MTTTPAPNSIPYTDLDTSADIETTVNPIVDRVDLLINNLRNRSSWTTVPLAGAGAATYFDNNTLACCKDGTGMVHLRGSFRTKVAGSGVATLTTVAQMPAGFLPAEAVGFSDRVTGLFFLDSASPMVVYQVGIDETGLVFTRGAWSFPLNQRIVATNFPPFLAA